MKYKLRRYYIYYLARSLAYCVYLIPLPVSRVMGALLGEVAFLILGKYRRITLDNLRYALGNEKAEGELRTIARGVFRNVGINAVEFVNFPKITEANINRFVTVKGIENLDSAFREGRGVLVLTAHFGNWELVGQALRILKYEGCIIGKRIYFNKYDEYLNSLRKIHDVNIIYRDDSPKKILRVLKDNKVVGLLADQDVDSVDGVFVDFFGHSAYTPAGPVALARVSGARIVPVFTVRQKGRYTLAIEKPVELIFTGNKEEDMVKNTQRWSDVVESYIRRYPDQWVWMHKRWKTRKEN